MNTNYDFKLLNYVLENSPTGIMITDERGNVIKANKRHSELTNYSTEELIGKNMKDLAIGGYVHKSTSLSALKTGMPMVAQQTINKGTINEKEIMVKSIPVKDETNKTTHVINYIFDISEKANLLCQLKEEKANNLKFKLELEKYRDITKAGEIPRLIYKSKAIENLLEKAKKVAPTDLTVLITGESGTGKSLISKYIHAHSNRRSGEFIAINCGAIPPNLMESELFGYEKGAFTGAINAGKKGIFEHAHGKTLFLDEIGELPFESQVKLLTVLQDGAFYRIGGTEPIQVDVRVIAATNSNLIEKIQNKQFRLDLFYRLNTISLNIPPLRERTEDIPPLIEHICANLNLKYGMKKIFSDSAVLQLQNCTLNGNVRELINIIQSNMVLSSRDMIDQLEITNEFITYFPPSLNPGTSDNLNISSSKAKENKEKKELLNAVKFCNTTTELAQFLNVSQSTISRRLNKYNINLKKLRKKEE
ncbi:sigma-54 interaction domain-containing protein [Anaerotignum sp. MB30-C6]|uniref:sigma-54 interaction domain-containing protein n=1 Tax=Anaerotignum sp. MB30-C6 TaxID=3070814 RepID=UPI0027DC28FD|nr:sigma 54-interacting transcriptional regulator [Anaerotignum sp. MB30-C6]WMI79913.1 sigma 54-interacting transcriptional regulator [Anaerotignum sp. MB30-C6]